MLEAPQMLQMYAKQLLAFTLVFGFWTVPTYSRVEVTFVGQTEDSSKKEGVGHEKVERWIKSTINEVDKFLTPDFSKPSRIHIVYKFCDLSECYEEIYMNWLGAISIAVPMQISEREFNRIIKPLIVHEYAHLYFLENFWFRLKLWGKVKDNEEKRGYLLLENEEFTMVSGFNFRALDELFADLVAVLILDNPEAISTALLGSFNWALNSDLDTKERKHIDKMIDLAPKRSFLVKPDKTEIEENRVVHHIADSARFEIWNQYNEIDDKIDAAKQTLKAFVRASNFLYENASRKPQRRPFWQGGELPRPKRNAYWLKLFTGNFSASLNRADNNR